MGIRCWAAGVIRLSLVYVGNALPSFPRKRESRGVGMGSTTWNYYLFTLTPTLSLKGEGVYLAGAHGLHVFDFP